MPRNLSRRRAARILQRIRSSDRNIKSVRSVIKDRKLRSSVIKGLDAFRRKGTTKAQRLFVRVGVMDKIARRKALSTLRKIDGGYTVKIGGLIRGKVRTFRSEISARRAVNRHHNREVKKRLGSIKAREAKKLFRN